jgi:hypothetical protein
MAQVQICDSTNANGYLVPLKLVDLLYFSSL